jgi:hypothetical protein
MPGSGGSVGSGGAAPVFNCPDVPGPVCGGNTVSMPSQLPCDVTTTCAATDSVMASQGCFPVTCWDFTAQYGLVLDASGHVVDVRLYNGTIPPAVRECALQALAAETFPCLAGAEIWQICCYALI